jgi:hypothetical protein
MPRRCRRTKALRKLSRLEWVLLRLLAVSTPLPVNICQQGPDIATRVSHEAPRAALAMVGGELAAEASQQQVWACVSGCAAARSGATSLAAIRQVVAAAAAAQYCEPENR